MSEVLRLQDITRLYREGEGQLEVFSGLSLSINAGEIVALVGPSGAGKSSLLHIAGLLEAPTSGEIFIEGAATSGLRRQPSRRRCVWGSGSFHPCDSTDPSRSIQVPF